MYLYYDPKVIKKFQLAKLDYIIYSYGITCKPAVLYRNPLVDT